MVRLLFPASNNVAEYEALINGLHIAIELGVRRMNVRGDSQLVIDQVMNASTCHNPKMAAYCQEVRRLEDKFDSLELNHVPRRLNEAADKLAKMASSREPVPTGIFASDQHQPSIRYEEPEQADLGLPVFGSGLVPTINTLPWDQRLTHWRTCPTPRSWKSTKNHRQGSTPCQTRESRISTAKSERRFRSTR
jgi:ribonuclease HI